MRAGGHSQAAGGCALKDGYKSTNEEITEADRELLKLLRNPKILEKLELMTKE
jgi:hypothetical protein